MSTTLTLDRPPIRQYVVPIIPPSVPEPHVLVIGDAMLSEDQVQSIFGILVGDSAREHEHFFKKVRQPREYPWHYMRDRVRYYLEALGVTSTSIPVRVQSNNRQAALALHAVGFQELVELGIDPKRLRGPLNWYCGPMHMAQDHMSALRAAGFRVG